MAKVNQQVIIFHMQSQTQNFQHFIKIWFNNWKEVTKTKNQIILVQINILMSFKKTQNKKYQIQFNWYNKKCGDFYIGKEEELIKKAYKIMKEIQQIQKYDYPALLNITNDLADNTKEMMDLIDFVETNREVLEHILLKVDKHTKVFDDSNLKRYLQNNYKNKDSTIRHFLEHPGLLRVYFLSRMLHTKLEEYLNFNKMNQDEIQINKQNFQTNELELLNPNLVNAFQEKMETLPNQPKSQKNIQNEIPQDSFIQKDQIRQKLNQIQAYLAIQSNFFQLHQENFFNQKGIQVADYYNVKSLKTHAQDVYTNNNQSETQFIQNMIDYQKDEEDKQTQNPCYNMIDLWFVLVHTFLYLANYYGLAMTSSIYTKNLGVDPGISGVLQASTPTAALITGFYFNWITTNNRYRYPYYQSLFLLAAGNFLYYFAQTIYDSSSIGGIVCLVVGRMLMGAGGVRLMTRKFISINIEVWAQSKYFVIFVLMSSLGETLGPGFQSFLFYVPEGEIFGTKLRHHNVLALIFMFIWLLGFFGFIFFFKGYDKRSDENLRKMEYEEYLYDQKQTIPDMQVKTELNQLKARIGQQKNFVISSLPLVDLKKASYSNLQQFKFEDTKKNQLPFFRAYFQNIITVFSLLCFMLFKMLQEAWFTELPKIANFYYDHSPKFVGFYLMISTCYSLPVTLLAKAANLPDRNLLFVGFILFILSSLMKINYQYDATMNVYQYYVGSSFYFASALLSEAASISILAKVISPTLKRSYLNAGLLSGTGDTLARAIGNASYTLYVSFDGEAAFSFYWYITSLVLLIIFFCITIKLWPKLQKYTIIKIFKAEEDKKQLQNVKLEI